MSPVSAFLIDVEDILLLLTDNVKNNPLGMTFLLKIYSQTWFTRRNQMG